MNIAMIGHNSKLLKEVAHKVALQLGYFYIDAEEYVEYDLVEKERALQVCSKEYLKQREQKAIQTICSYENTLISVSEDLFAANTNLFAAKCLLVEMQDNFHTTLEERKHIARQELSKQYDVVCPVGAKHIDHIVAQLVQCINHKLGEAK